MDWISRSERSVFYFKQRTRCNFLFHAANAEFSRSGCSGFLFLAAGATATRNDRRDFFISRSERNANRGGRNVFFSRDERKGNRSESKVIFDFTRRTQRDCF